MNGYGIIRPIGSETLKIIAAICFERERFMPKWFHWIFAGFLVTVLLSASHTAMADPQNEIAYRRATERALGGHMSALNTILSGRVKRGKGSVIVHARAIGNIGKLYHTLYPKGSGKGRTRAKPQIWTKPNDFKKAIAAFKRASAKLASVAGKGNLKTTKVAFKAVGKTCGVCHKLFRQPRRKR